ncbi:hypothetical protein P4H61_09050 [Paenibacillus peoriae]|uniref:hypothetical protein n=1 Tax=Paenibacillus peoriae TaxID=59893 RepID=UPI00026C62C6|nr:hypothetical protein [Paenibacillus peoriae]MEC0181646.1 hypothetical protein [Paenibacillus peoriae]
MMSIIVQAVLGVFILIGAYFAVRGVTESPQTHIYAQRSHKRIIRGLHGNGHEDEGKGDGDT